MTNRVAAVAALVAFAAYVAWIVAVSDVYEGQTVWTVTSAAIFYLAIGVVVFWAVRATSRRVRAAEGGARMQAAIVVVSLTAVFALGAVNPEGAGYAARPSRGSPAWSSVGGGCCGCPFR